MSLPTVEAAYQHLHDNVHAQVFFGKLASFGISPQTEKEASDLFALAARLRNVPAAEKQASSRFSSAVSSLESVFTQINPQTAKMAEAAVKQAAAELSADADIYNAVLALKSHEAQLLGGGS